MRSERDLTAAPRKASKRPQPNRRPISVATREAILRAAEEEFAARGFGGARADAIARRARVNKALPFYHFGSKARLYEQVLKRALGRYGEIVTHSFESTRPDERLAIFVRDLSLYLAANPNWLKIITRELIDKGSRSRAIARRYLKPLVEAGHADMTHAIESGQMRAIDPLQAMISVAGEVIFYFLVAPFLEGLGIRKPLAAANRAKREEAVLTLLSAALRPPPPD
ncbi:MAG: TetR/AcrR family transcriptional regulator [Candidatus Binataceae bacterium]